MQKNRWSRKFDWVSITDSKSGVTYVQKDRGEIYQEKRFIAVGDIYFKFNNYLTGVTFSYINSLKDIYKRDILTGEDTYSIFNMYNEFDIINKFLKNVDVDVAADTNIDLSLQWFSINDIKLKPNQLVLLKNQTSPFENDIYKINKKFFLENAGLLSSREQSDKFSCSIKMGKNKDKQFFLNTNGGFDFPITFESKNFFEGQSYILKNLISYNLYNTGTGATTSKMIFTDYSLARKQLPENSSLYNYEFYQSGSTSIIPSIYVTINYHHDSYKIRSGVNSTFNETIITGSTTNLGTKLVFSTPFNWNIGDYINLMVYSGSTGVTSLNMNTFIKSGSTNYIYLEEVIPNKILNSLLGYPYIVKNLNVAIDWWDAYDKMKNYTPYIDFYDVSGKTTNMGTSIEMMFTTKDCSYDKYFDYNALNFNFIDDTEFKYFETLNQYIKYNLYDRLSKINSIFTTGFTFFNTFTLSGFSYQYTDKNRIKIISTQTGLTNIFKPYTYVYAFASPGEKTLVYSVKDHEIIIEKPAQWIGNPDITAIQNIDGLKNISDILYEVYINESYDWYIHKSDNEVKYITNAYANILASSYDFRNNVTGLLFENENNEFILKLYKIKNDNGVFVDSNLSYKPIGLMFIGSDRMTRLPIPVNIISGQTLSFLDDWNVLNDQEPGTGEVFDAGFNIAVPTNNPALFYNVVDGESYYI